MLLRRVQRLRTPVCLGRDVDTARCETFGKVAESVHSGGFGHRGGTAAECGLQLAVVGELHAAPAALPEVAGHRVVPRLIKFVVEVCLEPGAHVPAINLTNGCVAPHEAAPHGVVLGASPDFVRCSRILLRAR